MTSTDSTLQSLSPEILYNILINNTPSDIKSFCQSNPLYNYICYDVLFWLQKLDYDYPSNPPPSSFVKFNTNDTGYTVYERFDDGNNGIIVPKDGFIQIQIKYKNDPINYAIVSGNIDLIIQYANTGQISQDAIDAACTLDNAVQIMEILEPYNYAPSQIGINWAAAVGNVNLLIWGAQRGLLINNTGYDWGYSVVNNIYSSIRRAIHMLDFIKKIIPNGIEGQANRAARDGYLDVLEWLANKNILPNINGIDLAAKNGHLDVLMWASTKYNIQASYRGIEYARANHHLEVVTWLHRKGSLGDKLAMNIPFIQALLDFDDSDSDVPDLESDNS